MSDDSSGSLLFEKNYTAVMSDACAQTENYWTASDVNKRSSALLHEVIDVRSEGDMLSADRRGECEKLSKANAELERRLATLQSQRIALEEQLRKIHGKV